MKMKNICLIREDEIAEPVKLCVGEVVIGRGPLLECRDQRVSRNHGLLKLSDDGNILLVPTHSNPCYYTAFGSKEKLTVSKGSSVALQDGDTFALLPDSLYFRVIIQDETVNKEVTEEHNTSDSGNKTQNGDKTLYEIFSENDTEKKHFEHNKTNDECGKAMQLKTVTQCQVLEQNKNTGRKISALHIRKRVLPSWMLEDNQDLSTPKKTKSTQSRRKKKETSPNREINYKQEHKNLKQAPELSCIKKEEDNSDQLAHINITDKLHETIQSTKVHTISEDEGSDLDTSNKVQETVEKQKLHGISDDEENDNLKDEHLDDKQQDIEECTEIVNATAMSVQQKESRASDVAAPDKNVKNQKRQQCKYGSTCYRKNPEHRKDFSHLGDEDFEDDTNKPECPYGLSCYRKNPLHRQNYRHTATPTKKKPQRQTKGQKKDTTKHETDEDSYDDDDPFINDASSDDYQPTDSDSDSEIISDGEEEENSKRMLKEAKKFVNKR